MVVCSHRESGNIAIVFFRTKRTIKFITKVGSKRKVATDRTVDFDIHWKLLDNDASEVAARWLASPIRVSVEAKKELDMVIGMKGNKIVTKAEDAGLVPAGQEVIGSAADLVKRGIKKLSALFNKLNKEKDPAFVAVPEYATVEEASAAVWAFMETYELPVKEVKAPKVKGEPQLRSISGAIGKRSVITLLVETTPEGGVAKNPKREGTKGAEAFSHYKNGQTVEEFVAAGGSLADVRWDAAHKFISLEMVADEPKPAKVKETPAATTEEAAPAA
jgi:hypothetical protein